MRQALTEHTPDHFGLPVALWSVQAVRALRGQHFRLDRQGRTVRTYRTRWGFTAQRPLKRAYERDPQADYPKIAARAKAEGAEMHWGDETAVSRHEQFPRGDAPKGKPPVLRLGQAKRERITILSSLTNQGLLRFMLFGPRLTAVVFITFLQQVLRSTPRQIFLIVDNLRVQRSRRVAEWVAAHAERIEWFFLPNYSPDPNPDEYLNADFKARRPAAEPVRGRAHLKRTVLAHLRSLPKPPARLRSYFCAPAIRYAA